MNSNLGTVAVTFEDVLNGVVATSNYAVTITITGPNGFSANTTSGVAVINVGSIVFPAIGTYSISATTGDLNSIAPVTFMVVPANPPTKLALASVAATVTTGGNLGRVTVSVETPLAASCRPAPTPSPSPSRARTVSPPPRPELRSTA